jgi:hypothetical protein
MRGADIQGKARELLGGYDAVSGRFEVRVSGSSLVGRNAATGQPNAKPETRNAERRCLNA